MFARRTLLVLLTALWPALAVAQGSKAPGFQVQLDGLLYSPSGSLAAAGGAELSSLLPSGPGFALTASVGMARNWVAAARVSYFGSEQTDTFQFVDGMNTNGQPFADGAGPYDLKRQLSVTAVHALLQYRHVLGGKMEWALELGGGVANSREELRLTNANGEKASAAGVQLDPSLATGAQLAYHTGWNTDLVGAARWSMSLADDGAVWSNGDGPAFLNWTLGVRYPRDTH